MRTFRGRNSRGGRTRFGRSPYRKSSYHKTRRAGSRSARGRNMRRLGIGLGVAGATLLAVNAGILGAAGTTRAVKELTGTARSIGKWAKNRRVKKAALKASSVAFHAKRVARIKIYKPKRIKIRRFIKR